MGMPAWSEQSESDLLVAVRDGDRTAFTELHRRMSRPLLHYVRQRVVDHAQAEEVLQEVFLEVWQKASRFDPERAKASVWLHSIAHHRAVDRIRHAQRSRDRDRRIGIRDHEPADYTTEDRMTHAEDVAGLHAALRTLTPLQREAVVLHYLHDLSNDDTARMLGVNIATFKTRVRDGLTRLRRTIPAPVA